VRLYNPFPAGRFSTLSRIEASATDARRISARMHNKMLVSDNALAVTGGRNLGDAYFDAEQAVEFPRPRLLVAGPIVRKLSASFDGFWNSDLAYPIETLIDRKPACEGPDPVAPERRSCGASTGAKIQSRAHLNRNCCKASSTLSGHPRRCLPTNLQRSPARPADAIRNGCGRHRANAQVGAERGDRHFAVLRAGPTRHDVGRDLCAPGRQGARVDELAGRDRARPPYTSATRATASTCSRWEWSFTKLRPQITGARSSSLGRFGSSHASLHAKALIIDRSVVLVGSMNMDPRSANLNSEIGLVLRSPVHRRTTGALVRRCNAQQQLSGRTVGRLSLALDRERACGAPTIYESEPAANPACGSYFFETAAVGSSAGRAIRGMRLQLEPAIPARALQQLLSARTAKYPGQQEPPAAGGPRKPGIRRRLAS